ncbi:hypothetical protein EDD11_003359 [Mortierella claussenii]|nr:hypothetical protein EDD11_003359 [Mortierella claussenii]
MPAQADASTQISTPSMLVDMTLPRPIPAKTALRMIRTSVKTIMFMRGQMGSPWETLEQMLQMENARQEQEEEKKDTTPVVGSVTPQHTNANTAQSRQHSQIPTKSLQEFLETGERTFVDLEEPIYAQLYAQLKAATAVTRSEGSIPASTLGGSKTSEQVHVSSTLAASLPTEPSTSSIPSPMLYISLAVVLGSTVTTPREQYMIRIGPLEPQQALLTQNNHDLRSGPNSLIPSRAQSNGNGVYHTGTVKSLAQIDRGIDFELDVGREKRQEGQQSRQEQQEDICLQEQQTRTRQEKAWERKLVHQIIGITGFSEMSGQGEQSVSGISPSSDGEGGGASTLNAMPPRSKVFLLMKAPPALVFQGMLPKQMVVLQEDYSLTEIQRALSNATITGEKAEVGEAPKRKKRWPILHLHILGPNYPSMSSSANGSSLEENDKIWYQIGSGIPALSTQL